MMLGALLLAAVRLGTKYLFAYIGATTIASNITLPVVVLIETSFGEFQLSLGVLIYSINYLATDICSEYGRKGEATQLAMLALATQVAFAAYMAITLASLANVDLESNAMNLHAKGLFSTTTRITVAAIVASLGAFLDIWLYEKIRQRQTGKGTVSLLARSNLSTIVGQGINTLLFFTIAFYGVIPNLVATVFTAWTIKCMVALLDSPFLLLAKFLIPDEWRQNQTLVDS